MEYSFSEGWERELRELSKREYEERKLEGFFDAASALVMAAALALALLFSSALPESARASLRALSEPCGIIKTPEPEEGSGLPILIRLADVEADVDPGIIIKLINAGGGEGTELTGDEPSVLIYHTHDTEAYRPTEDAPYEPSGSFRTEDEANNVFAVGEELKRILKDEYGIIAVHAGEKHEKPLIASAYERSIETMRRYKELYPSLVLFIDLHRDGVADTGYEDDFVTVEGLECARMMFVVGTGTSGKSSRYAEDPKEGEEPELPDFEGNYALALALTETLNSYNEAFMRKIRIKAGNYNQQEGKRCLLIEVGHNGNTLGQAKNSMIFLARAIAQNAAVPKG